MLVVGRMVQTSRLSRCESKPSLEMVVQENAVLTFGLRQRASSVERWSEKLREVRRPPFSRTRSFLSFGSRFWYVQSWYCTWRKCVLASLDFPATGLTLNLDQSHARLVSRSPAKAKVAVHG